MSTWKLIPYQQCSKITTYSSSKSVVVKYWIYVTYSTLNVPWEVGGRILLNPRNEPYQEGWRRWLVNAQSWDNALFTRTWLRYVRVLDIANLSVCRRLTVTFVHPTQQVEIFSQCFTPFCTIAICWLPCKILRRSSSGNSSVGVKRKRGTKI